MEKLVPAALANFIAINPSVLLVLKGITESAPLGLYPQFPSASCEKDKPFISSGDKD